MTRSMMTSVLGRFAFLVGLLGLVLLGALGQGGSAFAMRSATTLARTAKVEAKRSSEHHATRPHKVRSAWNTLRANLRHDEHSNRMAMTDDDSDDDDDDDVVTPTLLDRSRSDSKRADDAARTNVHHAALAILQGRDTVRTAKDALIRAALGHGSGTERPPRA